MLEICKKLFDLWNGEGVRYCHWKSNEHLEEGLNGKTDLDVFVLPQDKEKAESGLAANSYIKFTPQKGARYPKVDEWIGFDHDTGALIHVHLHYQIITGTRFNKEYVFPIDELMISTRRLHPETGVYVAAPELEIIVLYSRIALKATDKKHIAPGDDYEREIEYLKASLDSGLVLENCEQLMKGAGKEFAELIDKQGLTSAEWIRVYRIASCWLKRYRKYSRLRVRCRYRYYYLRNVRNSVFKKRFGKIFITKKTLPERGRSICFIGADGSGKSTVSSDIKKWLSWKIDARRFYLGSGEHYTSPIKKLIAFGASKKTAPSSAGASQGGGQSRGQGNAKQKLGLKRRLLRSLNRLLQSIYLKQIAVRSYKELKKAQKYVRKGGIALYDRFPQTQFAGIYDGPKIAVRYLENGGGLFIRMLARREERAIKKAQRYQPDLMFKLVLPPEESIRRKPDHTIEEVRPKAEITGKLVFERSETHEIDATRPYADELLTIKRYIWSELCK